MRGCLEARPLVVGKDCQPACDIGGVIRPRFKFRNDAEIGAKQRRTNVSDQLLSGPFGAIFAVSAEIASDAARICRPMHGLVAEDGDVAGRVAKSVRFFGALALLTLDMAVGVRILRDSADASRPADRSARCNCGRASLLLKPCAGRRGWGSRGQLLSVSVTGPNDREPGSLPPYSAIHFR